MRIPHRPLLFAFAIIAADALVTAQAVADVTKLHNVAFTAVRANPWVPGDAFVLEETGSIFDQDFSVNLPKLNGNPTQAALDVISDFLGVDLPIDISLGVGGSAWGNVGLDYGYYVDGGRLNINYPAQGSLSVSTYHAPATNQDTGRVVAGRTSTISTGFTPGVTRIANETSVLAGLAGSGYLEQMSLANSPAGPGSGASPFAFSFETFETPNFASTSPWASAWAEAHYDVGFGAYAEAKVCVIACFINEKKEFGFRDARVLPIVEVDPTGISIAGSDRIQLFDQEIDLPGGAGTLTLSYPKVAVGGNPTSPGSTVLHGTDSKPIITVLFDLEKYIPAIGEYLDGSLGPIDYHLLSADAGPQLSLYQDFTFTPQPKVQLNFSEDVMIRGADGVYRPGRSVTTPLGDSVDWRPVFGPNDEIRIQPTYILDNQFRNETGFDVGIAFDIEAISLETPIGDLGPLVHEQDSLSLFQVPFYTNTFTVPLPSIAAPEIVVAKENYDLSDVFSSINDASLTSSLLVNRSPVTGMATYQLQGIYRRWCADCGHTIDSQFTAEITGAEQSYLPSGETDPVYFLTTGDDVMAYAGGTWLNLGRDFRLGFDDLISTQWSDPADATYTETGTGNEILLGKLFEFRPDEVDVNTDPVLGYQSRFEQQTGGGTHSGPRVTIDLRNGPLTLSIAESHEGVPDGQGSFQTFEAPVINNAGQVAYRAGLDGTPDNTGDQEGIYRTDDDGTVKLVRVGDSAAAGPGELYLSSSTKLSLSESGRLTSHLGIQGAGSEVGGSGIFHSDGIAVTEVARVGSSSPNADGTYSTLTDVTVNESGDSAFVAEVQQPESSSYKGIFRNDGAATEAIVRTDQVSAGLNHAINQFADPSINAAGQVVFSARFTDASIFGAQGIYVGDGESLTTIAVGRITAPQPGEFNELYRPAINDAGQVAFRARGEVGEGIHRGDGSQTTAIAQQGAIAAGSAVTFLQFHDPHINDIGQVAFAAQTFNGASYDSGIFRGEGGVLTAIAVSNQSPDNVDDGSFDYSSFYDPSGRDFAFNNYGHVAFVGSLNIENGSVDGLFLHDGTHVLEIARTGQPFQGSTIQAFGLATGSDTEDGLNDSMQIAYTAYLADGRHVVARFEPIMLWKNAASGDWDTDENWSLGVQPTAPYDAAIIREDAVVVTGPMTDRTVRSLIVGGYGEHVNTLRLEGGNIYATQRAVLAGNAELVLASGRTLTTPQLENAGLIRGTGTIAGDVTNSGMIAPGNSSGTLTINGNYTQDAAGALVIELASGGHDQLAVSGDVALGGAIAVSLLGGFLPTLGQSFPVVNSLTGALNGTFVDVDFPTFSGLTFDVNYTTDSAVLEVVVAPALPGDFNSNGYVDAADYVAWRKGVTTIPGDYDDWRANFGTTLAEGGGAASFGNESVPEPATFALLAVVASILSLQPRGTRPVRTPASSKT